MGFSRKGEKMGRVGAPPTSLCACLWRRAIFTYYVGSQLSGCRPRGICRAVEGDQLICLRLVCDAAILAPHPEDICAVV